jgi:flavin reductase (DIM6/NTAB) family NADH-FMN oxidoreductase RutF
MLGANVEGKPNYCTIAWFTMIDDEPPTIGCDRKDRRPGGSSEPDFQR